MEKVSKKVIGKCRHSFGNNQMVSGCLIKRGNTAPWLRLGFQSLLCLPLVVALALCLFPQLQKVKYLPYGAEKNTLVNGHEALRTVPGIEKMLSKWKWLLMIIMILVPPHQVLSNHH